MRLFTRIYNLLLFPAKEWKSIADENNSRKTIYKQFIVPILCITSFAIIIGTWINTSREVYSFGYVIYRIIFLWATISAGLYISAFFVTEIMAQQLAARNNKRDFALIAYSSIAAYLVIIIVSLFPFFSEMYVLAFYSLYLYLTGIQHILKQAEVKTRMTYALLSFIIIMFVHLLLFFLFKRILSALLLSN